MENDLLDNMIKKLNKSVDYNFAEITAKLHKLQNFNNCNKFVDKPKLIIPKDLKILLVDDDEVVINIYQNIIKEFTNNYYLLSDGSEVDEFLNTHTDIKFLILDIIMPRVGGVEVLKRLKEINKKVYVTVVSGTLYPDSSFGSRVIKELYLLNSFHSIIWMPKDFSCKDKIINAINEQYKRYLEVENVEK